MGMQITSEAAPGIFFTTRFEDGIVVLYEGDPKKGKVVGRYETSEEAIAVAKEKFKWWRKLPHRDKLKLLGKG